MKGAIFGYFCAYSATSMRVFLCIILFCCSAGAFAQQQVQYGESKETYMAKRKEILEAIRETEKQLEAIKNDKRATMGELRALQNKLRDRQRLIRNINHEMQYINKDIRKSSREVQTLKQKLEQLKISYAQSIRYSYTSRSSYDMLAFIFSSRDFNEAMRRMKYLKKFRDFRKSQVDEIHRTQQKLTEKIGTLNAEKTAKDKLLVTEEEQKNVLEKEKNQTNKVIDGLKGKEHKLRADIEKNRKITERINKAIKDLIEREMAKSAKAAAKANESKIKVSEGKPSSGGVAVNTIPESTPKEHDDIELMLTPSDIKLADNFAENMGKMYWPVEKGYVIDHFGVHSHPLYPSVKIENAGVSIQTSENADVRCVFEGTVKRIFSVIGSSKIVMVKHGNYFTVYRGLEKVSVDIGDVVRVKEVLGKVTLDEEDLPVVNFQIWKMDSKGKIIKLNPEQWISKLH